VTLDASPGCHYRRHRDRVSGDAIGVAAVSNLDDGPGVAAGQAQAAEKDR
jgi:hypothetical protein